MDFNTKSHILNTLFAEANLSFSALVKQKNSQHSNFLHPQIGDLGGNVSKKAFDIATFGSGESFVRALLPSNFGLKKLNALQIQDSLKKNLKQIDNLMKLSDDQLAKKLSKNKTLVEDIKDQIDKEITPVAQAEVNPLLKPNPAKFNQD